MIQAVIGEKTLTAGTYTLSILGESAYGISAYTGSFTVGRPDQLLAVQANTISAVPEPSTYALLLAGLGLVMLRKKIT